MNTGTLYYWQTRLPGILSWVLMALATWWAFPYYQYYIDPDATAYLTISRRYALGDWERAINGYWSPWSCWGTALGIKLGGGPFASAMAFNFLGATAFLSISLNLARRYQLSLPWIWGMGVSLALFLVYAQFKQSFDDIWAFAFLLISFRLMISAPYSRNLAWAVGLGALGALGYFAKAYAFPFFVFQLICFHFLDRDRLSASFRIKRTVLVLGALSLFILPWIYLLREKYGFWTLGTAGMLNRSWFLLGSPLWKDTEAVFLPPVFADSPYYWEDPYWVNGPTPSFWEAPGLIWRQMARMAWNLILYVQSSAALSVFFLPVWILAVGISLGWRKRLGLPWSWQKLSLSLFLFPLAYFLVNFEPRYLWYMVPLTMILGGMSVRGPWFSWLHSWEKIGLVLIFWASYLAYPAWDMYKMFEVGKADYEIARVLQERGVEGAFTHMESREKVPSLARIAYFSGNPMYLIQPPGRPWEDVRQAMKENGLIYFYSFGPDLPWEWKSESGQSFPEILDGAVPGFRVWKIGTDTQAEPLPSIGN